MRSTSKINIHSANDNPKIDGALDVEWDGIILRDAATPKVGEGEFTYNIAIA